MKVKLILSLFVVTVFGAGCADFKTYMRDRGNDLADCFTARVGLSYGLGVRVQATSLISVTIGGAYDEKKVGYIGRTAIEGTGSWVGIPLTQFGAFLPILYLGPALFVVTDLRQYEDKALPETMSIFGFNTAGMEGLEKFCMEPHLPALREKGFMEVSATVGAVGFDLGVNPFEILDFLLGWFTFDITGDDRGGRYTRLEELVSLIESDSQDAADRVVEALKDSWWKVRLTAAERLFWKPDKRAVKSLILLLKDERPQMRQTATRALRAAEDAAAVEGLIGLLDDKELSVQRSAIEALGAIGGTKAASALIKVLEDEKSLNHIEIITTLGEMGATEAVPALIARLDDEDDTTRRTSAKALALIGDTRAVEPLIKMLEREDWSSRAVAAEALSKLGDARAIPHLIEALKKHREEWHARNALESLTGQDFPPDYETWKKWYEKSKSE